MIKINKLNIIENLYVKNFQNKKQQIIFNPVRSFSPKIKFHDTDFLFQAIYNLLKKEKKQFKYTYSFLIDDNFPYKNYFLEALYKDILYLLQSDIFFMAILYNEYEENTKKLFVVFYFERSIKSYYKSFFKNTFKFLSWYHRKYVKTKILEKFLNIYQKKNQIFSYMKKGFISTNQYLYYIFVEMSLIDTIDKSEPIKFMQKVFFKIKRWCKFFFAFFGKYAWKNNEQYLFFLASKIYREENFNKGKYLRWIDKTFSKIWISLQEPNVEKVKYKLLEEFFLPEDIIEETPLDRALRVDIFRMRTTIDWKDVNDKLKLTTKIIGSHHFNDIIKKLKIK